MAEAEENSFFECPFDFEVVLEETTKLHSQGDTLIQLKPEQWTAIKSLACGKDVQFYRFWQKCNFSLPGL